MQTTCSTHRIFWNTQPWHLHLHLHLQMAALLNLESLGEVGEVGLGQGGGRLVLAEVRLVLGLRTDFAKEEIKRLRLS